MRTLFRCVGLLVAGVLSLVVTGWLLNHLPNVSWVSLTAWAVMAYSVIMFLLLITSIGMLTERRTGFALFTTGAWGPLFITAHDPSSGYFLITLFLVFGVAGYLIWLTYKLEKA